MSTLSFFYDSLNTNLLKWNYSDSPCDLPGLNTFQRISIKKNNVWKPKDMAIKDQYIICKTKDNRLKWLNYENSRIKINPSPRNDLPSLELSYGENQLTLSGNILNLEQHIEHYSICCDFSKQYKLKKRLGRGTFAEVFTAKSQTTEDEYAVKIFHKQFLNEGNDKQSLIKEIKILRMLTNESSVRLSQVFETQNCLYVVMEKIQGGNLSTYLERNAPLSEKQTQQLIYQLLKSVSHIHQLKILHRDLKPDNIMFREKDNLNSLCITDFGLADFYNPDGNYLFTRCGSPGFVAPEILHDQLYDFKVDLYSIGIIMYCAINGNHPFQGNSEQRVQKNYLGDLNYSKLCLTSKGMTFLKEITNVYPAQRISLLQALMHSWFQDEHLSNKKDFKIRRSLASTNKLLLTPQFKKKTSQSPQTPSSLKPIQSPVQQQSNVKRMSNFMLDDAPSTDTERKTISIPNQNQKQIHNQIKKSLFKYLQPIQQPSCND